MRRGSSLALAVVSLSLLALPALALAHDAPESASRSG